MIFKAFIWCSNLWPDEEGPALPGLWAEVDLLLLENDDLVLRGDPPADDLSAHAGPDDLGRPHVPHAAHERQVAVVLADDGPLAELQRLGALGRPRQFREDYTDHERLRTRKTN